MCKKSKLISKIYYRFKPLPSGVPVGDIEQLVNIPEITPIGCRPLDALGDDVRLNIIVPSVNKEHVFGGIATALQFFFELVKATGCKQRIIVTDSFIKTGGTVALDGYKQYSCSEDSTEDKQLVAFGDRYNKTIPVGKHDIFIATGWWTAYNITPVIKWQAEHYGITSNKLIYLIQDYEPCFYPWSSRHLLADSTYRGEIPTVAIFNAHELKDYFDFNGYKFDLSYCFEPILNTSLKGVLEKSNTDRKRKKRLIVYGRPGVQRNAFELVVNALRVWASLAPDSAEWELYSLGEAHPNVKISESLVLKSCGKLSLEGYAEFMLDSYMALSLMVSPHPSYPPLEMSTFGIKTVTNTYANKDLAPFNGNIISVSSCSADSLAHTLLEISNAYDGNGTVITDSDYFRGGDIFGDICASIADEYLRKI